MRSARVRARADHGAGGGSSFLYTLRRRTTGNASQFPHQAGHNHKSQGTESRRACAHRRCISGDAWSCQLGKESDLWGLGRWRKIGGCEMEVRGITDLSFVRLGSCVDLYTDMSAYAPDEG